MNSNLYFFIVSTQVTFVISSYLYVKRFVEDLRDGLMKNENVNSIEMEGKLIEIIKFHLDIKR